MLASESPNGGKKMPSCLRWHEKKSNLSPDKSSFCMRTFILCLRWILRRQCDWLSGIMKTALLVITESRPVPGNKRKTHRVRKTLDKPISCNAPNDPFLKFLFSFFVVFFCFIGFPLLFPSLDLRTVTVNNRCFDLHIVFLISFVESVLKAQGLKVREGEQGCFPLAAVWALEALQGEQNAPSRTDGGVSWMLISAFDAAVWSAVEVCARADWCSDRA